MKMTERLAGCALSPLVLAFALLADGSAHAAPHVGDNNFHQPAGTSPFTVIASGLANPRSIFIVERNDAPTIYVTEAGTGGNGPCVSSVNGDYQDCYGATGAITRITNGVAKRIATGLPSIAGPQGGYAIGPSHIVAHGQSLFVSFASYASAEQRAIFSAADPRFGKLLKFSGVNNDNHSNDQNATSLVADLSAFEDQYNPDGDLLRESNPSGLAFDLGRGFYAVDSGANDLLVVQPNGKVSLRYVFPTRQFPAPSSSGQPTGTNLSMQAVPVTVAQGPDKAHYVGEFTGYPYPKGAARVFRFGAEGDPTIYAEGFTNIIDIAFGPDGSLYVLEMARNGLLSGDVTGAVTKIAPNGTRTLLASDGLAHPTAIAVDRQGNVYVANYGTSGNAQLIRF